MSKLIEYAQNLPEYLRKKREKVFVAFDIYKQNVSYGLISETQKEHETITEWYLKCLNLDKEALDNVPNSVKRFLQK